MVKKILIWAGVAFLILFIAYQPSDAAEVFRTVGRGMVSMAQGFGDFIANLARG
jgi:hypothetical protein